MSENLPQMFLLLMLLYVCFPAKKLASRWTYNFTLALVTVKWSNSGHHSDVIYLFYINHSFKSLQYIFFYVPKMTVVAVAAVVTLEKVVIVVMEEKKNVWWKKFVMKTFRDEIFCLMKQTLWWHFFGCSLKRNHRKNCNELF